MPNATGPRGKPVTIEFLTINGKLYTIAREKHSRKPVRLDAQKLVDRLFLIPRQKDFSFVAKLGDKAQ